MNQTETFKKVFTVN